MINTFLIGTKKHGCQIDNDRLELIYFDYLSLIEKLQKKSQVIVLKYSQIDAIKILYGLTTGVRFDTAQITMEITTYDKKTYDIPITYNNTKKEDLNLFISILLKSGLKIIDPYNILAKALESNLDIIDFIKYIDKTVHKNKN